MGGLGCWLWGCRLLGLALVLGVVLPYALRNDAHVDFPQLYMAGAVAAEGRWEAVYPEPLAGATHNAAYPEASVPHAVYEAIARRRGVPEGSLRFIYPPPVAILCWPLAWLSYPAAVVGFAALSAVAVWVVGLQAGWVHRAVVGRPRWVEGPLTLSVCGAPMMVNGMRSLNISMLLGVLVGGAVLGLLRKREVTGAVMLTLGGVFKASTAPLALVYLAAGRWKALAMAVGWTVLIVGGSLAVMGRGPFAAFFVDVAPTLAWGAADAANQSLLGLLARVTGDAEAAAGINAWVRPWGLVAVVLVGLGVGRLAWLDRQRRVHRRLRARGLAAGAFAALMLWMLLSPLNWPHYQLLLAPLWGWLWWEVARAWRGRRRTLAGAIVLAWVSLWFPVAMFIDAGTGRVPEPWVSHGFWSSLALAGYAVARLGWCVRRAGLG
ncbi:MAG: glycosyltransferase family 87 protein [Planctomycetota bacterium]